MKVLNQRSLCAGKQNKDNVKSIGLLLQSQLIFVEAKIINQLKIRQPLCMAEFDLESNPDVVITALARLTGNGYVKVLKTDERTMLYVLFNWKP